MANETGAPSAPITGWIMEAGELPAMIDEAIDTGVAKRIPRAMLIQFDTIENCQAVCRGAPVVLQWGWDHPKAQSSAVSLPGETK